MLQDPSIVDHIGSQMPWGRPPPAFEARNTDARYCHSYPIVAHASCHQVEDHDDREWWTDLLRRDGLAVRRTVCLFLVSAGPQPRLTGGRLGVKESIAGHRHAPRS